MIKYRSDIDGLRAFAVLAVIIFHFKNHWLPAGFLGVDIFFVISGYLITSIIYSEINEGQFSISQFYIKRFRRIFPVMWAITFFVLIAGILLFLPSDLKFLVQSIKSILTFSSNYFFAGETDYFNPTAEQYPLLHYWSLALEEQFYFIWPVFLSILVRNKKSKVAFISILFFLTGLSFVLWELSSYFDDMSKFSYYALPTRMGALFIGGILAVLHSKKILQESLIRNLQSVFGFAILVVCMVSEIKFLVDPALKSLVACLAVALIIDAGSRAPVNRFLSLKGLIFVGSISYSLYLWHWPILAFLRYQGQLTNDKIVFAIVLIFFASILTKVFIEDRFRKVKIDFKSALIWFWIYPGLFFLVVSILIFDSGGFPERYYFSSGDIVGDVQPFYKTYCHEKIIGDCMIGESRATSKILLIGDSHAGHFMPFWDIVGKKKNVSIYARSSGFCTPTFEIYNSDSANCKIQKIWFKDHYKDFEIVILGGRWEAYLADNIEKTARKNQFVSDFTGTLQTLQKNKISAVIMAQIPKFKDQSYEFLLRKKYHLLGLLTAEILQTERLELDSTVDDTNRSMLKISKETNSIFFFDPIRQTKVFLQELPFRKKGMAYKDATHLNEAGSKELANVFLESDFEIPFIGAPPPGN